MDESSKRGIWLPVHKVDGSLTRYKTVHTVDGSPKEVNKIPSPHCGRITKLIKTSLKIDGSLKLMENLSKKWMDKPKRQKKKKKKNYYKSKNGQLTGCWNIDGPSTWLDNGSSKWTDQSNTKNNKSAMWTEYNGLLNEFQTTIESIQK